MPDFVDRLNDTRHIAADTAAAQLAQGRAVKAVSAVQQNAFLPVAKAANVQRIACYTPTGTYIGLVRPQRLLPPGRVQKAGGPQLIAVYDDRGKLIGAVDPKAVEGLARGESFSFDEGGRLSGIIGSDGRVRSVQLPAHTTPTPAAQAEQDAAATVAANAPAPGPTAPAPVVAKSKRPAPTWEEATATLRQLRLKLARERVAKAQAMDTRGLGTRDEVIRLLDLLEPVLKRAAPPEPKRPDAEQILRELGKAANAILVRKSGNPAQSVDPMVAAALVYRAMQPAQQAAVRKALARTSVESRQRARRALTAATNAALDPVGELRVVAKGRTV